MVELSRVSFQEPDLPLSQKKSEVILAKKTVLIGQVMNGGPLPNPPQHTPVCSFDSQNKFRGLKGLFLKSLITCSLLDVPVGVKPNYRLP